MCTCWRHSYRRFHARQFSYILRPGSYETHVLLSKQLVCTFTTYCTENNVHNIMRTIFQGATLRVTLIPNRHHMCMCWVFLKNIRARNSSYMWRGDLMNTSLAQVTTCVHVQDTLLSKIRVGNVTRTFFQGFFANDIASEKTPHVHVPETFV